MKGAKEDKSTLRAAAEDENKNNVSGLPQRAVTSEPALHNLTFSRHSSSVDRFLYLHHDGSTAASVPGASSDFPSCSHVCLLC